MKKMIALALSFYLFTGSLVAALPPLYQDISELKAILNDERLGSLLQSGETIQEISHVDKGYVMITNKSTLFVEIVYKPSQMPGPAQFEIKFGKPQSIHRKEMR